MTGFQHSESGGLECRDCGCEIDLEAYRRKVSRCDECELAALRRGLRRWLDSEGVGPAAREPDPPAGRCSTPGCSNRVWFEQEDEPLCSSCLWLEFYTNADEVVRAAVEATRAGAGEERLVERLRAEIDAWNRESESEAA